MDDPPSLPIWLGIVFCISQSAMFSGLNLAVFSIGRLQLEVEAATGNKNAVTVLAFRRDANFTLVTILWGNVGINVLLTLLSDSILTGLGAFLFSTVAITLLGEIFPQAYGSRHALQMAACFAPVLRIYQCLLYPVAKPLALLLNWWLGTEGTPYFQEQHLQEVIRQHIESEDSDVSRLEGIGAMNFLDLDDVAVGQEGEVVDPHSILYLPLVGGMPAFPAFARSPADAFLQRLQKSGKKWVILVDDSGEPCLVINSDSFLRGALFGSASFNPYVYCHRPIVVHNATLPLGQIIGRFRVHSHLPGDDVIDHDILLLWGEQKRIITGADLLGRLLRGIATREGRSLPYSSA